MIAAIRVAGMVLLLGMLAGCGNSNEEDFMATSGPGWTPPGAPVDGTGPPASYVGGEVVEAGEAE